MTLDQIVAPISLYPDPLLAQILMASTYPLEVVQAARFAKDNANLTGDQLDQALKSQSWDDSVKSLVTFPQVLTMMDGKLDYVAHGRMIGGFALMAYPAQYGVSGVMTFIVNHQGVVYQKDLGPITAAIAKWMRQFDPDASWTKAPSP